MSIRGGVVDPGRKIDQSEGGRGAITLGNLSRFKTQWIYKRGNDLRRVVSSLDIDYFNLEKTLRT